jgi:lipopolysaccharide/colanic/teichoic acid biosynthesis glycosyltransferase
MLKRFIDILIALCGLLIFWPLLLLLMLLIWLQDFCNPLYVAPRARARDHAFNMIKLRSMVSDADKKGGVSTAASDLRITWIGKLIRKTKLDEVPQLWNVLMGNMSLVGPRPQVMREVALYTEEEYRLFRVRPGITDIASIVFSDEGEILKDKPDPDLAYNQLIRPWKSRLGLLYAENSGVILDVQLIFLTIYSAVNRRAALDKVAAVVARLGASAELIEVARRIQPLHAAPPPGGAEIVTAREVYR